LGCLDILTKKSGTGRNVATYIPSPKTSWEMLALTGMEEKAF